MKNVSDKRCLENQNTHFVFNNFFHEIMQKNIVERGRLQMTIWRMRIAYWLQTRSEYVTLIAFPLQQWLNERASVLNV